MAPQKTEQYIDLLAALKKAVDASEAVHVSIIEHADAHHTYLEQSRVKLAAARKLERSKGITT